MNNNVFINSLGCEKNTVDSEHILAILKENNYTAIDDANEADVIIVNTCAFVEDAKKESIEAILEYSLCKQYGKCSRLIVSGCMAERYKDDFLKMMPEVDAIVGIHNLKNILLAIDKNGAYVDKYQEKYMEYNSRHTQIWKPYSYIRISDGCHSKCSFCAIPLIRGNYRSRTIEAIVQEAKTQAASGIKEINLIAQETTYYGKDIYKNFALSKLLGELNNIDGIEWIRVLYQNPAFLNKKMVDEYMKLDKVVPYFDIPMQHVNSDILKDMNRLGDYNDYIELIKTIRGYSDDIAIRSSFIVGFPGESNDEFEDLLYFIEETKLDRVGIFIYSKEDGTKSIDIKKKKASRLECFGRREKLMEVALEVSAKRLSRFVGRDIDVLVQSIEEDGSIVARSKYDAPDIDGLVYIDEKENETDNKVQNVKVGDIVSVKVSHSNDHDLFAKIN